MTSPTNQPSAPTSAGIRRRTTPIRFLIVGIVLLGVAIMNLFAVVQDWSTATSSGFIGDHAMPLAGAVIGAGLVVTGAAHLLATASLRHWPWRGSTASAPGEGTGARRAQPPSGAGASVAWSRVAAQEARSLRASSEGVPGSAV